MGDSTVPRPVFIHTNLGTRLALPVSPDITAKDFKREVEGMHLDCFPEFGSIRVDALMVKQKSRYYHLSESLPLKYAFPGPNVTWFLQINVHPRGIFPESLICNGIELHNLNCIANCVADSMKLGEFGLDKRTKFKRKKQRSPYLKALKISALVYFLKGKRKRKNVKKTSKSGCSEQQLIQTPLKELETFSQLAEEKSGDKNVIAEETFPEAASVSGIIKRYFSDYDEVASGLTTVHSRRREWVNSSNERQHLNMPSPQVSRDVWLERPQSEASLEKCSKPEVGKRLLKASDSLGLSPSNKHSVVSLHKYCNGRSPLHKWSGPVKNLVFEITEESE